MVLDNISSTVEEIRQNLLCDSRNGTFLVATKIECSLIEWSFLERSLTLSLYCNSVCHCYSTGRMIPELEKVFGTKAKIAYPVSVEIFEINQIALIFLSKSKCCIFTATLFNCPDKSG